MAATKVPPPRLAATIILCKPKGEHYAILMVKRSATSRFYPGAHVFPGGIWEENDKNPEWKNILRQNFSEDLQMKITAVRELFEETNVLLTSPRIQDSAERNDWRNSTEKDASKFLEMCREFKCRPALDKLIFFDHWITPVEEKWRYDTHFYLAINDINESNIIISKETPAYDWFEPAEALRNFTSGIIKLAPPTWFLLTELSKYPKLKDLIEYSKSKLVQTIQPRFFIKSKPPYAALPGDYENGGPTGSFNRIVLLASNNYIHQTENSNSETSSKL